MLLKTDGLYVFGAYRLDARERQFLRGGQPIPLPPKAFDLLVVLVARAGFLVTKEELLAEVWTGTFVEDANLSYTISLLRKALGADEGYIETVPKRGYRFIAAATFVGGTAAELSSKERVETQEGVSRAWIAAVLFLLLVAAGAGFAWRRSLDRTNESTEVTTVPITSFGGVALMPRLSPDGSRVAYHWNGKPAQADFPNWDIYVQSVEGGEPLRLTNDPAEEFGAAWSPDGESIAFLQTIAPARYRIQRIPASGGTQATVSPPDVLATGIGIDWSPDGHSIAFMTPDASGRRGLALLSLDSLRVTPLTLAPIGSIADRLPRFSPDGATIAFSRMGTLAGAYGDLYTIGIVDRRLRQITSGGRGVLGHDWTADGKELVFSSNRGGSWMMWRVAADGSGPDARPVAGIGTDAYYPSVARKQNRLTYFEQRLDHDIWRVSVSLGDGGSAPRLGTPVPVQNSTRFDGSPQVSPDGRRLVFVSKRSGDQGIWVSDIDGRNPLLIAAFRGFPAGSPRWSPTGTRIAFDASVSGHANIFVVGAQGVGQPSRVASEIAENVVASWSWDEKWIYFASNRTGRYEVWKVPSEGGTETQVTNDGGFAPFESRDGKFVYYVKNLEVSGIWRVSVGGGDETLVVDGPTARFWGYWALLASGICFATQDPDGRAGALVKYFDFATKSTRPVGHLDAPAIALNPHFAMTPDGKSILYVKAKPSTSDIMLVKNFR